MKVKVAESPGFWVKMCFFGLHIFSLKQVSEIILLLSDITCYHIAPRFFRDLFSEMIWVNRVASLDEKLAKKPGCLHFCRVFGQSYRPMRTIVCTFVYYCFSNRVNLKNLEENNYQEIYNFLNLKFSGEIDVQF